MLGPNLFEALRRGQVVAGMVQEPALTLIVEDGGKVLFNAMDIADSTRLLGGAYEFMGVAYRAEEREERLPQMQKLARALERGLVAQRTAPIPEIRESLPAELLVGGDGARFDEIIARYRESLYPESVAIDVEACARVVNALEIGGVLAAGPRPRHAARHRGRAGVTAEARPRGAAPPPDASVAAPVVQVRDLRMRYGEAEPVIDGVSLEVGDGQVVSLVGPSGSGKSTVLRAISGLHPPDGGAVELGVAAGGDRLPVPGRRAAAVAHGAAERGARAAGCAGSPRPRRWPRPTAGSTASGSPASRAAIRASSRAASASGWRWRRCWR